MVSRLVVTKRWREENRPKTKKQAALLSLTNLVTVSLNAGQQLLTVLRSVGGAAFDSGGRFLATTSSTLSPGC